MKRMLMYKKRKKFGREATDLGIKRSERSSEKKKVKALKVPNCEMQCLDSWYMRRGLKRKKKSSERADGVEIACRDGEGSQE